MSVKAFVDTNVLVSARDASKPEKQARATDWMATLGHRFSVDFDFFANQPFVPDTLAGALPCLKGSERV